MSGKKLAEVKKEIEDRNLWYFVKCQHCDTSFLVEESIDNNPKINLLVTEENLTFQCHCPRCGTLNTQIATTGRLLLHVVRLAKRGQFDPLTTRLAKKVQIEDIDHKKD
jgi:Zn finger protein HypA/HybF involved in hydrogenase expression